MASREVSSAALQDDDFRQIVIGGAIEHVVQAVRDFGVLGIAKSRTVHRDVGHTVANSVGDNVVVAGQARADRAGQCRAGVVGSYLGSLQRKPEIRRGSGKVGGMGWQVEGVGYGEPMMRGIAAVGHERPYPFGVQVVVVFACVGDCTVALQAG